jgi:hydrogenase expression/formation protein HypC
MEMCLGVPGEVMDVGWQHGLRFGRVRFGAISRNVCLEYQPDVAPGDFVLVHVGFAIATIDRDEAARAWAVLEGIGQTSDIAEGAPTDEDIAS